MIAYTLRRTWGWFAGSYRLRAFPHGYGLSVLPESAPRVRHVEET